MKKIIPLLVLAASSLMLTGCLKGKSSGGSGSKETSQVSSSESGAKVTESSFAEAAEKNAKNPLLILQVFTNLI